jgi:murein tripeptide amidase MpaA
MKLSKILVILLIVCLLFAGCKPKTDDQPEGSDETIEPAGDVTTLEDENYTYDKFLADAQTITSKYPTKVQMGVFGKSAFNRELLYFAIGDKNATKKILVVAGVFGTESSLSLLATKQIETYLEDLTRTYKNKSYQQILNSCRIYFVPMLNPDGVSFVLHHEKYNFYVSGTQTLSSNFT